MERLKASGIESAYGRRRVLTGVSLIGHPGECIGIVGANGCGKSTLLNILAGLRRADKGTVAFDGMEAQGRQGDGLFIRYTGYVPQESNLIEELNVWDNLLLWYEDKGILKQALESGFLHMLEIDRMLRLKAGKLSGGMKKRVSIGCALAGSPPILILDEPGAALDLPGKAEVRRYLAMYKSMGGMIVLATHEERDLDICDRIYALIEGKSREIDKSARGEALMRQIGVLNPETT